MNKEGAVDWTIGKLMMIVLLVVVLALVMYGVSTKGLNPLIERAGGMFDSVQILFGFGNSNEVGGNCGTSFSENVEGVGRGVVRLCRGSCSIKLENGLSLGNEFNWTGGSLFVQSGTYWKKISDIINNVPLVIKEREVNGILKKEYEKYVGDKGDSSFMGSRNLIYIFVKGHWGRRKYFKWDDGFWFEEKNKWEKRDWNDIEGLRKIYSESNGWLGDDEVFYRVGISNEVIESHFDWGGEDSASLYKLYKLSLYKLLNIFSGDSGKISNNKDFEIFKDWFFSEKAKIVKHNNVLSAGQKNFEDLLSSESPGEFEGKPYFLSFARDSDGEGVFYLETSSEKYGLKGGGLALVKYSGEDGWKFVGSSLVLSRTPEEFKEDIRLHKIRKFLEVRCE